MQVLLYNELDGERIPNFPKLRGYLEAENFRSADVKKVADGLYRARLDASNRVIFTFARCNGETYILVLECIERHAYEKSRFLRRGVAVEDDKLPAALDAPSETPELSFVNPARRSFNILDKVISFDDAQQQIYTLPVPLILIGSAGSGKTVLTLEKMKHAVGNVLYVTRSSYLADNSRDLYYGMNYRNEDQEVSFLSYAEFLDSIKVPASREMTFAEFAGWFSRHRQASGLKDAYQFYEEVGGVIAGSSPASAWLDEEEYLSLGIRQSIYAAEERPSVHALFRKYLEHLKATDRHDINVLSYEYQALAKPTWDFVVVDEVQDFTNVQLHLVLRTLAQPMQFILCGDSNQIVHPNFFSWAGLKRYFFERDRDDGDGEAPQEVMRILTTNYRSSAQVTEVANRILRLKTARFRSVDKESSYLVTSNSKTDGAVVLLPESSKSTSELDAKTRASTQFAVIVLHAEDKARAKKRFHTPLVFSIREAKGLEYENIILYDFVSSAEDRFREIVRDVDAEQVQGGELRFARARDKSDKSLEIFKFHINALYVAATRAVSNVYLVESTPKQRLFALLGIRLMEGDLNLADQKSSLAEWQREARRLERQGKQEQAEAVRATVLGLHKTPWQPLTRQAVSALSERALAQGGKKDLLRLFEHAVLSRDSDLLSRLKKARFRPARRPPADAERALVGNHFAAYSFKNVGGVRAAVDKYGVDHRDAFGWTPLMLAARFGHEAAAIMATDELSANLELVNSAGLTAFQIMLQQVADDPKYASRTAPALHRRLAPGAVTVVVRESAASESGADSESGRLLKIDGHKAEFLFYNLMVALCHTRLAHNIRRRNKPGLTAADLEQVLTALPAAEVPEYQTKRSYISSVLARNEVDRDLSYNRRLFKRASRGHYILNPALSVRVVVDDAEGATEQWTPIYELLNASNLLNGDREDREDREDEYDRVIKITVGKDQIREAQKRLARKRQLSKRHPFAR